MVQPEWYYNLQSGERESPLGYVLQCLLESRMRLGQSSVLPEEEEVNVYLGHLLLEVMTPAYRELHDRYVAETPVEVFHKVEHVREPAHKFLVYRANADHRLLNGSVFHAELGSVGGDEGSTYYHCAAEYNKQIYRRATPLSGVLDNLADEYHVYGTILTHMRHAYFHLWRSVSDETLQEWLRSIEPPAPSA